MSLILETECYRKALQEITKAYVDAPGWANPEPTTELVWKMYSTARKALARHVGDKA